MKKPLRFSEMLPNWFDLRKYDRSDDASLVDWGLNLAIRRMVKGRLEQQRDGLYKPGSETEEDFSLIKQHGFLQRSHTQGEYQVALYDVTNRLFHDGGTGKGLVYSLPLVQAVEIAEWVKWDTQLLHNLALIKYQDILHDARKKPLSSAEEELANWYHTDYQYTPFHDCYETLTPYVCVDLDAPDESIIDAFKAWLRATRERPSTKNMWGLPQEVPGRFSNAMINRWRRNAILPYLDLQLHQLESGIELPLHMIGNAIFSTTAEIDTTEAVRKTTRPSADRALELAWTVLFQAIRDEEMQKAGKK